MNNKGQVLVMFLLLLPIMLLFLAFTVDTGNLLSYEKKLENNIEETISYGLDNIDEENVKEKMNTLLESNINKLSNINIKDKKITIELNTTKNSLFKNITKKTYDIKIKYVGYINNNKKIIEKVK